MTSPFFLRISIYLSISLYGVGCVAAVSVCACSSEEGFCVVAMNYRKSLAVKRVLLENN